MQVWTKSRPGTDSDTVLPGILASQSKGRRNCGGCDLKFGQEMLQAQVPDEESGTQILVEDV